MCFNDTEIKGETLEGTKASPLSQAHLEVIYPSGGAWMTFLMHVVLLYKCTAKIVCKAYKSMIQLKTFLCNK